VRVALLSRAVFPLHGYGGLERHVAALEKYLRLAGCDVSLVTTPPSDGTEKREGTTFVPYRLLPWPKRNGFVVLDRSTNYLIWSLRAARRLLALETPDVVQADAGAGFGYAALAGPGAAPLVLHPHGMEEFKAPFVKRSLYLPLRAATRFAARRAARVLVPDAAMKDEVKRYLGVEDDRLAVVPNALDLDEIDRMPAPVDVRAKGRVLLSVGRLESNKGFSGLVRALAKVPDEFQWILVGDGPAKASIEGEIARAGLGGKARLAGRVSDDELHALYERAELFVHPTLYEGSSMVTLEAMAHRKPVVASRVGGIPDKVVPGESGLLVPPGDPEALAAAIRDALSSKEQLARWGAKGRAIVEERFSWSRRVKELVSLYESLRS
jgi:glycosyltransferase involved in cell wall biosynthesis